MARFYARYKDPDGPFDLATAGVEHFEAESKTEVLRIARSFETDNKVLALVMINEFGSPNQIWNAIRAARPERNGDGWFEDIVELFFPNGFPD